MSLSISAVPCFRDNYAYLVSLHPEGGDCIVIDPGEAQPVIDVLEKKGLRLRAIVNTHHHWDHVSGNLELVERYCVPVVGHVSERERIPGFSQGVAHKDNFEIAGFDFTALHVPGHTSGAIAYCVEDVCFTGDTLFCAGCGRLSEGTPADMYHSLNVVLGELPDSTRVFTGHEYTLENLKFASEKCPTPAVKSRLQMVRDRRASGLNCANALLLDERATNPFLRVHTSEWRELLGQNNSVEENFAVLREWKDQF